MKKKTIIFFVLALLFIASGFSGNYSSPYAVVATLICFMLGAFFAFLGYRSIKTGKNNDDASQIISYSVTPPPSISESSFDDVAQTSFSSSSDDYTQFDFFKYKLSGVTFKNEDGTDRQSILRKIKFNDPPFDGEFDLELCPYEYNGEPAYAILANGMQIGNIPAKDCHFIHENSDRLDSFGCIDVYGGGRCEDGTPKSYGCSVTIKFRKQ